MSRPWNGTIRGQPKFSALLFGCIEAAARPASVILKHVSTRLIVAYILSLSPLRGAACVYLPLGRELGESTINSNSS